MGTQIERCSCLSSIEVFKLYSPVPIINIKMNTRCASTLFVVTMSVIAVVHGVPANNIVSDPLGLISGVFVGENFSGRDVNLQCYCTPNLQAAKENTFVECPFTSYPICMTQVANTTEYGLLYIRGVFPESLKDSCWTEVLNYTLPYNPWAKSPKTIHFIDDKISCCETDNCNN